MSDRVHVLVPVHNNWECTRSCLEQLQRQGSSLTITVVDDGSTDATAEALSSQFPAVRRLLGGGQLWWAGSMNLGLDAILPEARPGDFVLSLNNDTRFPPMLISSLVERSQEYGQAVVAAPCVSSRHNTPLQIWGQFDWEGRHHRYFTAGDSPADPDFLISRAVLYPVKSFANGERFNAARLPHYHADLEFTARLKRQGHRLAVAPRPRVEVIEEDHTSGLHRSLRPGFNLACLWQILTSRRSAYNLKDMFRLIDLCAPPQHRWRHKFHFVLFVLGYCLRQRKPSSSKRTTCPD